MPRALPNIGPTPLAVRALLLLGLAPAPGAQLVGRAQDAGGEELSDDRAFVETLAERTTSYVHEPLRLVLRFGFDEAFFAEHALQTFQRELGAPVSIDAPWVDELAGAVPLAGEDAPLGDGALSFVLGDRAAEARRVADRTIDGRTFAVAELERSWLATSPGELVIPELHLRFAYATRFEDDFVRGRVPLDRHDAFVRGAPLALRILPLPEAGRPPDFGGAVGSFTVHVAAEPRELRAGESLKLVLSLAGRGNFGLFEPPRLAALAGFHVAGRIADADRRRITYDATPIGPQVREVPPIAFPYFDPGPPAGYRTAWTESLPITVLAEAASTPAKSAPDPRASNDARSTQRGIVAGVLAALALALGALGLWLRRRACAR